MLNFCKLKSKGKNICRISSPPKDAKKSDFQLTILQESSPRSETLGEMIAPGFHSIFLVFHSIFSPKIKQNGDIIKLGYLEFTI